jgi:NADPH-dependent curcumin reductase CurA
MTRVVSEDERQLFEVNGYVLLRGFLTAQEVGEINREFHQLWIDLIREGTIRQQERIHRGSYAFGRHVWRRRNADRGTRARYFDQLLF